MQRGAPAAAAGEEEEEDYMSEKFLKQQEAEQRRLTTVKKRPVPQAKQLPKREAVRTLSALTCMRCVRFAECRGRL